MQRKKVIPTNVGFPRSRSEIVLFIFALICLRAQERPNPSFEDISERLQRQQKVGDRMCGLGGVSHQEIREPPMEPFVRRQDIGCTEIVPLAFEVRHEPARFAD